MKRDLTLYVREGCHLCEEFLAQLVQLLEHSDTTVSVVDVDRDPHTASLFGLKVPVLVAQDGELCHYELDQVAVRMYLSTGQNPIKYQTSKGAG
jgi:glutaredoxin 2